MSSSQALIRYTYLSKPNSDAKMSASITTQVPGKFDSSVLKSSDRGYRGDLEVGNENTNLQSHYLVIHQKNTQVI